MKKIFTAVMAFFILGTVSVIAQENDSESIEKTSTFKYGLCLGGGFQSSVLLKPYIYESTSFMIQPTEYFSADLGLGVLMNPLKSSQEPFVYLMPVLNITFYHFYIGGGPFFILDGSETIVSFFVRTGAVLGNWDWGSGKGNLDIGFSVSPTLYLVDVEKKGSKEEQSSAAFGAAIGSIFGSIFNVFKLSVGVTWFLPF